MHDVQSKLQKETAKDYLEAMDISPEVHPFRLWEGDVSDELPDGTHGCETWFSQQSRQICEFAEQLNISEVWIREDYQEMNELLITFFHGTVCTALHSLFIINTLCNNSHLIH